MGSVVTEVGSFYQVELLSAKLAALFMPQDASIGDYRVKVRGAQTHTLEGYEVFKFPIEWDCCGCSGKGYVKISPLRSYCCELEVGVTRPSGLKGRVFWDRERLISAARKIALAVRGGLECETRLPVPSDVPRKYEETPVGRLTVAAVVKA